MMHDDKLPDREFPQDDRDISNDLAEYAVNLRARRIIRDGESFDSETDELTRSLLAAMVRELQELLREVTFDRDAAIGEVGLLNEHWSKAVDAHGRALDLADRALKTCETLQDENAGLRSQVETLTSELEIIRHSARTIMQRPLTSAARLLVSTLFRRSQHG